MNILIINAGSSSLKYQLIDMQDESVRAKGQVERIGIEGSNLKQKVGGLEYQIIAPMKNHIEAIEHMLKALTDSEKGAVKSMDEIGAVGHRVLHGGADFTKSMIIDDKVMDAIRACIPLGPLHNPANIMGIEACQKVMPNTPMVAVFDTAFHQTMPAESYLYGIPMEYYERLKIRRYGFHGTSHRYVSKRAADFLGVDAQKGYRMITCHLGNGSSICAVKDGKCFDTSMGLTPLEGVLMGTRSGSVDPAALQFIMNSDNISVDEMLTILNKKSGLLGISGKSSDMRDIDRMADEGDERCIMARNILVHTIKKFVGAYAAEMGGVDAIVFTAGIGENNNALRERIMDGFEYLGAKLDKEKNKGRGEMIISTDDSKVKILVIPTNEELAIARDTLALVSK
ncbi:MAG: acetate kinase [Eubacteriales bacterium]|nr:acetate kinase [Eubacteriales bacterium]MDD3883085.1 acetate kinase [Eubacteriales bacterium]MDD4512610.1 acetate kinase [Eubacteriales bacterium]